MAEETTQPSGETPSTAPAVDGGAGTGEPEPTTQNLTAEELDTQWRNRFSQRDKAHAAETRTLREQITTLTGQIDRDRSERETASRAGLSEAGRVAAERDDLAAQLKQEREARAADVRRLKFPNIAAEFDDSTLATFDEAKLASLNEKIAANLTTTPPSLIDPNSAARTATPSGVSVAGKTKEQLLEDLRQQSPSFSATLGQGQS